MNALGQIREVDLAPLLSTRSGGNASQHGHDSGHWTMPIKDDPFEMSWDEINDFFDAIKNFILSIPGVEPKGGNYDLVKQDKSFASTEGQYCTQRLYRSSADLGLAVVDPGRGRFETSLNTLSPAGLGFEHIRDQPIRDQILALIEEVREDMALPVQQPDVGRYDTVLDAQSVAYLMEGSIGLATELDRALGYEANAGGTSYITDPLAMLGTLRIGSPIVGISGNRQEHGGVATVQWDDEGVRPTQFPLVEKGVLSGMQTNREGAGWLRDYYMSRKTPVASGGCSYAPEAIYPQSIRCANLAIAPSPGDNTFDTLVGGITKGVAFKRADTSMDFQQITGMMRGSAYQIRNGKRVARVPFAGILFRTPEIWNAATVPGGAASAQRFGIPDGKGEPRQESYHSVTSVPMAFKDLTIVDIARKA
jgi:TldD protein